MILNRIKILRTTTIPLSLNYLLKGQLRFLNQYFEIVAVSGNDSHLQEVAKREGVRVVPLAMERAISPLKDLVTLLKLYRLFRKERPLIVHSITPKAGLLSMMAAKMAGVPIRVHTFTGLIFPYKTGFFQRLLIVTDRLLCWAATNVYPEGKGVMTDLIQYNITSKPLKVLANGNVNGVDTKHFSSDAISNEEQIKLRTDLGISSDCFIYLFVGRLVRDKGINELVEAFSEMTFPNIKLLLVGQFEENLAPLKPETMSIIKKNPNIITVGFQKEVRPYFAISSCLVFPSYREGFPNVVIQAGCFELPSIVSNVSGCNEIIIEGVNGTILPNKNVEVLSSAMIKMKEDTQWYSHLKSNARYMITSRYDQKVVWDALLSEYKNLLENV